MIKYLEANKIGQLIDISDSLLERISEIALEVDLLLKNELAIQPAYLVTPKGAYDADILTLAPQYVFPPDLLQKAEYDITECAKALVFELPTACGFHLMRVFEAVLKNII